MSLYFSNEYYREKALKYTKEKHASNQSVEDAVLLLIEEETAENLSNLCELIQAYFEKGQKVKLSLEECYKLTQGKDIENKITFDTEVKNIIYKLAYRCLESGKPLGTKTIMDGKINTSDWMGHSLFEGKLAGQLAQSSGLDVATAQKMGILHDYGRKFIHDFSHVTKGFEELTDKGWEPEAIGCLTHSFLAGGRCSCNEQAEEGFYVDEEGNSHWREDANKDDLTVFLDNYEFTKYDIILNIADLMATSNGIVSPSERIADIATRRKEFDPTNRSYFLAEFTNKLIEMLQDIGGEVPNDMRNEVKAAKGVTLEEITQKFERASELFYAEYQKNYSNSTVTPKDIAQTDIENKITYTETENAQKFFEEKLKNEEDIGERE